MPPTLALILCIIFVLCLLWLERKHIPDVSFALWIPTLWTLISASRPVGRWFYSPDLLVAIGGDEAGSPIDRMVLSILILLALYIIARRKINWPLIIKDNFVLAIIYVFILCSALWADLPLIALKRSFRLSCGLLMGMIILSENRPFQALECILRRCAYVLIPFSIVLIKYYPDLGVEYNRWTGGLMWTGVTMQKNALGMLSVLSIFLIIWSNSFKWQRGELFKVKSVFFADALIAIAAVYLLSAPGGSYSATSIVALAVAIFILLLFYRAKNFAIWTGAHLKTMIIAMMLMYFTLNETILPIVTSLLGRSETLTGRHDIWRAVLDAASQKPLLGHGYGGFWGLDDNVITLKYGVKQAHSGYLGVYLELGIVGVGLILTFIFALCNKVRRGLTHAFKQGIFGICFLILLLLYNYSESAFFQTGYLWTITMYLSIVLTSQNPNTDVI
jgi:exopolysaccharide production protein ExoQ